MSVEVEAERRTIGNHIRHVKGRIERTRDEIREANKRLSFCEDWLVGLQTQMRLAELDSEGPS